MGLFYKNNKSEKLKVFYIYIICNSTLLGGELLLKYIFPLRELYLLNVRVQLLVELSFLLFYFIANFQTPSAKKFFKIILPLFIVITTYDYIVTSKTKFGADQAIAESFFMLLLLFYFFFEKIKYDVQAPLYESKIFWIAGAFFIFFAGNFFLLIYSKSMSNNPVFKQQYLTIYNSFNIIKNLILCIALYFKETNKPISTNYGGIDTSIEDTFFFNNPNS